MKHAFFVCRFVLAIMIGMSGCAADDDGGSPNRHEPPGSGSNPPGDIDAVGDPTQTTDPDDGAPDEPSKPDHTTDWPGPLSPEEALDYMKKSYGLGLVIVDVTPEEFKLPTGFEGSIYIPYTELEARNGEIPTERPVILHCARGRSSVKAYPILFDKRKDIPELSYIAGEPPIEEYNNWLVEQNEGG